MSEPELPIDGPAAPPRRNGELIFEAPWQSRVFGITVALAERGLFTWRDFQRALIAAIARREASASVREHDEPQDYWSRWSEALVALLREREPDLIAHLPSRIDDLAARPAGHDHEHPHEHD